MTDQERQNQTIYRALLGYTNGENAHRRVSAERIEAAGIALPGSGEACRAGCQCRILENAFGLGNTFRGKRWYWIYRECELHRAFGNWR